MRQKDLAMDFDRKEFAMALKTYRLRRGLTQRELGAMWGLSRFTIMRAENTKIVSWEHAYRLFALLADALRKEGQENAAT